MEYEIDFLPVGDNERGGDAIVLQFGNLSGLRNEKVVMVIDGGNKETGELLVQHVLRYYKTDSVDFVVSTHPDADHSSGLSVVLEKLKVSTLLMHRPWEHADEIKDLFKNENLTVKGLEKKIEKSLQNAYDLEKLASQKNIPIYEPFAGLSFGNILQILGPSEAYYKSLVPHFRGTPEPKKELGIFEKIIKTGEEVIEWVAENLDIETLDDSSGHFSAENSSSVIMLLTIGTDKILFTGDADIIALTNALDQASLKGISLLDLHLLHVPHHGSKHNVGPSVLNQIKAAKAQISAPKKGDPKHPSRKVVNALIRRQNKVFATKGATICHHSINAPIREGWSAVQELSFYNQVEQ